MLFPFIIHHHTNTKLKIQKALLLSPDSHQLTTTSSISTGSSDAGDQPSLPLNIGTKNMTGMTAADTTAINRRTSKVSGCFGNTMCMPQNLLCFKVWLDLIYFFNLFFFDQISFNSLVDLVLLFFFSLLSFCYMLCGKTVLFYDLFSQKKHSVFL